MAEIKLNLLSNRSNRFDFCHICYFVFTLFSLFSTNIKKNLWNLYLIQINGFSFPPLCDHTPVPMQCAEMRKKWWKMKQWKLVFCCFKDEKPNIISRVCCLGAESGQTGNSGLLVSQTVERSRRSGIHGITREIQGLEKCFVEGISSYIGWEAHFFLLRFDPTA